MNPELSYCLTETRCYSLSSKYPQGHGTWLVSWLRSFLCPPSCVSDTDPVKQEEPEADRRLGVRDRRRGRRERRSTGIVQPGGEVRKIISTLHHQKHGRQFSVKKLLQRFALILASANQFLRVFSFCSYMWVWKSGRGQTTSSLSWCNWIFNKSTFFSKKRTLLTGSHEVYVCF